MQWTDIGVVWDIVWDATFTFVGLIIISLILDAAGFFNWAALHVARWGNGRGHLLFPLVVVLGAVIAAFFANDGAALLLTPIVIAILLRLNFSPPAAFAFIIATGFVADTTSLPLVISNLVAERLARLGGTLTTVSNHYNSTVTALAGKQGLYGKVERFNQLSARVSKTLPQLEPAHMDFESERLAMIIEPVDEEVSSS